MAGTIQQVEEINRLIHQVAETEKVSLISASDIQPLYDGQALKENLTRDGGFGSFNTALAFLERI